MIIKVRRTDTRGSFETRISFVGVCDHNKELYNQRVPLGFTSKRERRERGERERGREEEPGKPSY
jgi:hypothetical protein